jgi:hypothetical protein
LADPSLLILKKRPHPRHETASAHQVQRLDDVPSDSWVIQLSSDRRAMRRRCAVTEEQNEALATS